MHYENRPKSSPASSTFNEFLTQLKEEDRASSPVEDLPATGSESLHILSDKIEDSDLDLTHSSE